jgi:hypothetical protein
MGALPFSTVPDWTSWENQGASVAVESLKRDGSQDMIVLRVDAPPAGPNAAFYRVGFNLDTQGQVDAWGRWTAIPDWASSQDEGAGIAVADFGAQGLALVVLQVRGRGNAGPNDGRFRIGRGLDATGQVGSWSAWHDVPDWGSFRDQGAAVAVADIDHDGSPDLVVLHVDDFHTEHPDLPNKGRYRIGQRLTPDGQVAVWSDWKTVDWESWFNQGAGAALADLGSSGQLDLVVFQVDNPPGENSGKYRVGWNIDVQGDVHDGWGPWSTIDDWDSWEDQGGGLALAAFGPGQRPKAVVLHVDNPAQLNAGRYLVTDLVLDIDQAASKGTWRLLPYFSEVLPVHAALLNTGKVLFFAGSGNNVFRRSSPDFGSEARMIYTSVVWDFQAGTFDHPPTLRRPDGSVVDYFCCGHCALPDGRLLVGGGSDTYDKIIVNGQMQDAPSGFTGLKDAMLFDPATETWKLIQRMEHARWYPTLLMLSDGTAIAASGLDDQGTGASVTAIERIVQPDAGSWAFARDFGLPLYPHLFVLEDGRVLYTGGKMDTPGRSDPLLFEPLNPTASLLIGGLADADKCNQSASVILPPAQLQQFMILGGGPEDVDGEPRQPATTRASVVDLRAAGAQPQYQSRADLKHERMHVNAVLLPDRTVLATGGGVTREASVGGAVDPAQFNEVLEAEIYHPDSNTWTTTAPATVARLYHSVALLLPDGRVVTAGGNPDKGRNVTWLPADDPMEEMRLEIYSPPYLFKSGAGNPRPAITDVPGAIGYSTPFMIETARPQSIAFVSLIRPGLTTHSFNVEQRLIDVPVREVTAAGLRVEVDVDARIAPPGWYMLFLTDTGGVPSAASWVHLS